LPPAVPAHQVEALVVGVPGVLVLARAVLDDADPKPRLVQGLVAVEGLAVHLERVLRVAALEQHRAEVDQAGRAQLAALRPLPVLADRLIAGIARHQPANEHRGLGLAVLRFASHCMDAGTSQSLR